MRLTILCLVALALVGCGTMESVAKGTFEVAWDAAEKVVASKIPALEGKVMDYAKAQADRALDSACQYAATKACEAADKAVDLGINRYKIDVSKADDYAHLLEMIRAENERRKTTGEDPITNYGTLALLAGLSIFQFGKSGLRVLKPEGKTKA